MLIVIGICFIVGFLCLLKGWKIGQKSEAYDCIGWLFGGAFLIVISLILVCFNYYKLFMAAIFG